MRLQSLWTAWKSKLLPTRDRERDLQRELQSDLDLETEEQQDAGLSREEAGFAARRALGNAANIAEDVRSVWSSRVVERLLWDLKLGARTLRRQPGFTIVAVLTLALGIGANTAIFSAIDALLLRPLPFSASDQLVRIYSTKDGVPITGFANPGGPSAPDVRDFEQGSHSFQKMVLYDSWRKNVSFAGTSAEPQQMRVGLVSAAYFEALGVQPVLGRSFAEDEIREDRRIAAITTRLWKSRFAADPGILRREVRINGEPYNIVAVMPDVIPDWMEPARIDIWTPASFSGAFAEGERGSRGFATLARLKPGVSIAQAQADLEAIAASLAAVHPADEGIGVQIKPLSDTRVGNKKPMLFLLMGAVTLILLIACVNLASLLLARNWARQRELAVRSALGAQRSSLLSQLLIEALLVSGAGGLLGVALARLAVTGLAKSHPADFPQLGDAPTDWRVLAFTLGVSVATALLVGLAPALTVTRQNLAESLKRGGRSGIGAGPARRLRNGLVVSEIALSLMILVAAGLLLQSTIRLQTQDLGVRQDHLLKAHFYLPRARYSDASAVTRFCDEFGRRIRALPGVTNATVTTVTPPYNGWTQMLDIPGRPATRMEDVPSAQFGVTDSHFLTSTGIPLLRGRNFRESDGPTSPPVALISRELARLYFPSEDPVGRRIRIGPPAFLQIAPGQGVNDSSDVTIVGVIGGIKNHGLQLPPEPQIITLYSQQPLVNYGFKEVLIRTQIDPHEIVSAAAGQLHQIDPDLPLAEVQTIGEIVDEKTGGERLTAALLTTFAVAGLVLAIVGIYGVVSYLVNQRGRELALRMAVGATPGSILWLVVKEGLSLAIVGVTIGIFGAIGARQLIAQVLFGISPVDAPTFVIGALSLLTVGVMASMVPGLRASRIDPIQALRQE